MSFTYKEKEKMVYSDGRRLGWIKDWSDPEQNSRIPELFTPSELTTVEDNHLEVGRLLNERNTLIHEVVHLNKKLRELKNKNETLVSRYKGELEEKARYKTN